MMTRGTKAGNRDFSRVLGFSLVEILFSSRQECPHRGAQFIHVFTCSAKLCFINVYDCPDARATVLMTDNCLNELFVRNTVIPVGMKADPAAAGGVNRPLPGFREEQPAGFRQSE